MQVSKKSLIDSILWFVIPLGIFSTLKVGLVSGDAISHSETFRQHTWHYNPNHLFLEISGFIWQEIISVRLLDFFNVSRSAPDRLLLLSVLTGSLSFGIFRYQISKLLKIDRLSSNVATFNFSTGSAFLRMFLSGEHFMIQMPFLVLFLFGTLEFLIYKKNISIIKAGVGGGISCLCVVSNCLNTGLNGIVILVYSLITKNFKTGIRFFLIFGIISFSIFIGIFYLCYSLTANSNVSFLHWITSYGGDANLSSREGLAYGMQTFNLKNLVSAFIRSIYGTFSSFTDIQPLVGAIRDKSSISFLNILELINFLLLIGLFTNLFFCLKKHFNQQIIKSVILISLCWLVYTVVFGTLWNNSDDQFYFQLSPVLGLIIGSALINNKSKLIISLTILISFINLTDIYIRYIQFNRDEQVEALSEALKPYSLIIMPGANNLDSVTWFITPSIKDRKLSIFQLSDRYVPQEGLKVLNDEIQKALNNGNKVAVLDIFDTPRYVLPWKHLDLLGYNKEDVIEVLEKFKIDPSSRNIQGYYLRSITN